jgi:hypothetical protein
MYIHNKLNLITTLYFLHIRMPIDSYRRINNQQILVKNSAKFCSTRGSKLSTVNAENVNTPTTLLLASKVIVEYMDV